MGGLNLLLSLYSVLILIRIVLTWMPGANFGQVGQRILGFIAGIVDPYLNFFRRYRFLRIANLDFSPVMGIVVLSILTNVVGTLARVGVITLGLVLALIVSGMLRTISFFCLLFALLAVVRLIALLMRIDIRGVFWMTLDRVVHPLVHGLSNRVLRGRPMSYQTMLGISIALLGGMALLTSIGRAPLSALLVLLPF